jgi:hypothetical protein
VSAKRVKERWRIAILLVRNIRRRRMKNISCIVYFDPLGDFTWEKASCENCWKVWSLKHPDIAKQVTWTFTDDMTQLFGSIPGADFVFFDYGGLSQTGHESLGMSFARSLEKYVTDFLSVEFILLCTMGALWYEDDYLGEHPNLHFEDVNWHALFDKFLGGEKCQERQRKHLGLLSV